MDTRAHKFVYLYKKTIANDFDRAVKTIPWDLGVETVPLKTVIFVGVHVRG